MIFTPTLYERICLDKVYPLTSQPNEGVNTQHWKQQHDQIANCSICNSFVYQYKKHWSSTGTL